MRVLVKLREDFRNLNAYSWVCIRSGLQLAIGLLVVCFFLGAVYGRFGDPTTVRLLYDAVRGTVPTALVVSVFAALLCDLEAKYRGLQN